MSRRRVALRVAIAITLLAGGSRAASAQGPSCAQPLAAVTASERSYANVSAREFDGRVFVYVPEIKSSKGNFEAFQLWIVEGVYGRPFVQASGSMDASAFERLRKNTNIKATSVNIRRSGDSGRATIGRQTYQIDVRVRVGSSGADSVTAGICRSAGR